MTARLLARFRPAARRAPAASGPRPSAPSRRRAARAAVYLAALAFALVTVALAAVAETAKPEWRDPEYGFRLRAAHRWQRERPDRPLVAVLGSSRAQMGVSPEQMGFPDAPGAPLVYNFGYRCASPLLVWLQLVRLLDDGLHPRAVLLMFSADEIRVAQLSEDHFGQLAPRFSAADLRLLERYAENPELVGPGGDRNPWAGRRPALVANLPGPWRVPGDPTRTGAWERMDRYGFSPFPAALTPAERANAVAALRRHHAPLINNNPPSPVALRIVTDLVARCRAAGIAVAACWAPDAPAYRAMCGPDAGAADAAHAHMLAATLGVPVFPAPDDFADADFPDGYHLGAEGAGRYSRWLADRHLGPWLTAALK